MRTQLSKRTRAIARKNSTDAIPILVKASNTLVTVKLATENICESNANNGVTASALTMADIAVNVEIIAVIFA